MKQLIPILLSFFCFLEFVMAAYYAAEGMESLKIYATAWAVVILVLTIIIWLNNIKQSENVN